MVPKYRYRILKGLIGEEIYKTIQVFCGRLNCEEVELNVQNDHVNLLVKVPPNESITYAVMELFVQAGFTLADYLIAATTNLSYTF